MHVDQLPRSHLVQPWLHLPQVSSGMSPMVSCTPKPCCCLKTMPSPNIQDYSADCDGQLHVQTLGQARAGQESANCTMSSATLVYPCTDMSGTGRSLQLLTVLPPSPLRRLYRLGQTGTHHRQLGWKTTDTRASAIHTTPVCWSTCFGI